MKWFPLAGILLIVLSVPKLWVEQPMQAQNSGLHRTILQRADASVPGCEMVMARVELDPQASAGRHTHPGNEMAYVIEGEGELSIEGQPTRTVRAGDSFSILAGVKHDVHNAGTTPFKVVAVLCGGKG